MLDRAGERVHRDGLCALRSGNGGLCRFHDAVALERGDLHDFAAKLAAQLCDVDHIAVLADNIHHIDGDNYRYAELHKLCG